MKTILFKQLSHLEKQETFWTKMLPIIIRKIKLFRLLVASLGSRGYFVSYQELDSSRRETVSTVYFLGISTTDLW